MNTPTTAIVVLAPPHLADGSLDFGRVNRAIVLANRTKNPLIVLCGDGNGGKDLEVFAAHVRQAGFNPVLASNDNNPHTRGDCRAGAKTLANLADIQGVVLVTCWYHTPRALVVLRDELCRRGVDLPVQPKPVWAHWTEGARRWLHWHGEPRGLVDALLKRPQVSRGPFATRGKRIS